MKKDGVEVYNMKNARKQNDLFPAYIQDINKFFTKMYSRYLLKTNLFDWIYDILLPFSRRTHRVRTAKMSLYNKNPSRNISFRKFREYIIKEWRKDYAR